jgi:hypothetical protein
MTDSRITTWTPNLITALTGNEYMALDNGTNAIAQISTLVQYILKSRWVDFYGADETGASDSLPAFIAMFNAKGYIECNPAGTYRLDGSLPFTNQNVFMEGNGCTLIMNFATHNVNFIQANNAFSNQQTVSSIALASVDFGSGSNTTTTQLTYGSAHGYVKGDWLRIGSNDLNAGSNSGANEACGELVLVDSVPSSTTLNICGVLKETYATSVRTWKMDTSKQFKMQNFKLDCVRGLASTANANMVQVEGYFSPQIDNVQILYSYSGGIIFKSCYKQRVNSCDFNNLQTSSGLVRYGYGICAYQCEEGVYNLITGSRIRHLYTTGSNDYTNSESASTPWHRGRTRNEIINGSTASFAENGAYSTHTDADGITFNECVSDSPIGGPDGGSVGFAFRGRNIKANSCTAKGGLIGMSVFAENSNAEATKDFAINDFVFEANQNNTQAQVAISINGGFAGNNIPGVINNPKVIGGNAQTTALLVAKNADVTLNGFDIKANQATGGRIIELGASGTAAPAKLRMKGGVINYTGAAGTGLRSIWLQDTSVVEWENGEVIAGGAAWNAIVDFKSAAGSATIKNLKCDAAPSTASGAANSGSATLNVVSYKVNNGAGGISGKITATYNATGNQSLALGNIGDDTIYFMPTVTATGVALNSISAGAFIGQELLITPLAASTQSLTVNDNSGGLIAVGSNKTVGAAQTLRLYWSGSIWTGAH